MEGKEAFDRTHQLRSAEIRKDDLVLCHDSSREMDMSRNRKLSYRWLGPYRIQKAIPEKGTYILQEFDRTSLAGTYAGNRLKKFVKRNRFYIPIEDPEGQIGSESEESEQDSNLSRAEIFLERSSRARRLPVRYREDQNAPE